MRGARTTHALFIMIRFIYTSPRVDEVDDRLRGGARLTGFDKQHEQGSVHCLLSQYWLGPFLPLNLSISHPQSLTLVRIAGIFKRLDRLCAAVRGRAEDAPFECHDSPRLTTLTVCTHTHLHGPGGKRAEVVAAQIADVDSKAIRGVWDEPRVASEAQRCRGAPLLRRQRCMLKSSRPVGGVRTRPEEVGAYDWLRTEGARAQIEVKGLRAVAAEGEGDGALGAAGGGGRWRWVG